MYLKTFTEFLIEATTIEEVIAKAEKANEKFPENILRMIYEIVGDKHIKLVLPLARLYKKANYDINELPALLDKFEKNKVDIGKFKSFTDLKSSITNISTTDSSSNYILETDDPRNTVKVPKSDPDFPLFDSMGKWKIFEVKSWKAATMYTPRYNKKPDGSYYNNSSDYNLGWCTGDPSNPDYIKPYLANGKLYVLAENNKISYQLFKENGKQRTELEGIKKEALNIEEFKDANEELQPFFEKIGFKKVQAFHYHGRRIPYEVLENGDIYIETVDISDLGLTTLTDLPWLNL